ncbi:hypothetical protein FRB97_006913 [Tulasnella sp. 331]|nr:hypothetical protein FRB97_006913 [Tulasnella sp. 331]
MLTSKDNKLSSITILAWDWLTSLDEEIAYIWTIKSSMGGKYLYLFFRYAGTLFEVYNAWQELGDHNDRVLLFTADALLSYRALCLWRMKRKLLIVNAVLFITAVVTSGILLGFAVSHFTIIPTIAFSTGCAASTPIFTALAPIPGMFRPPFNYIAQKGQCLIFEIWIFAMVITRVAMFSKSQRFKNSSTQTVDILQLLVHDAMWWFTFISFLLILNAVFFAVGPEGATGFFLPYVLTFSNAHCVAFIVVMGCRLIVRMRKAHLHNQSGGLLRSQSGNGVEAGGNNNFDQEDRSIGSRTQEANHVGRILHIARRVGLPPALPTDLDAFWDDPIRTINHAVTSDELAASSTLDGGIQQRSPEGSRRHRHRQHPDIGLELHALPTKIGGVGRTTSPSRRTSSSSFDASYDDDDEKRMAMAAVTGDSTSYVERMWRTETSESYDPYDTEDTKTLDLFVAPMARKPMDSRSRLASAAMNSVVVEEDRDPTPTQTLTQTPTPTGRPVTMITASSSSSRHRFS